MIIPAIPNPLIVSPNKKYPDANAAAGDRVVNTLPVLGLSIAYILKAKKSPMVSPTTPESPSHSQEYAYGEEKMPKKKSVFTSRFVTARKITANSNLK